MRDTIDMAREAELICSIDDPTTPWTEGHDLTLHLKAFEALVRADEREACAQLCEDQWQTAHDIQDAIRARGNI
jgi:hypothetical protein